MKIKAYNVPGGWISAPRGRLRPYPTRYGCVAACRALFTAETRKRCGKAFERLEAMFGEDKP